MNEKNQNLTEAARHNERKRVPREEFQDTRNYHQKAADEDVRATDLIVRGDKLSRLRSSLRGRCTTSARSSPAKKITRNTGETQTEA